MNRNLRVAIVGLAGWLFATSDVFALPRGTIVVGDQGRDALIRIDPAAGSQSIISTGGSIQNPFGLVVTGSELVTVSDTPGGLFSVDPQTGQQTAIPHSVTHFTRSIRFDSNGDLLVAGLMSSGSGGVSRVDPESGVTTPISTGGFLKDPMGMVIDVNGDILLANFAGPTGVGDGPLIIRIDPNSGNQTVVSNGSILRDATGLALTDSGVLYAIGNVFNGVRPGLVRVDMGTGEQTLVSSDGYFAEPFGLALDINGDLLVADRGTASVFRVNPTTSAQTLISQGAQLLRPISIAVVTVPEPASWLLLCIGLASLVGPGRQRAH